MKKSRNRSIIILTFCCLFGILAWQTPEKVWTVMANPEYNNSSEATVKMFWKYVDQRQLNLAQKLIREESQSGENEFATLQTFLEKNPLTFLDKLEMLGEAKDNNILVRVAWKFQGSRQTEEVYRFSLSETVQGWRILEIKRLDGVSLIGIQKDKRVLERWS